MSVANVRFPYDGHAPSRVPDLALCLEEEVPRRLVDVPGRIVIAEDGAGALGGLTLRTVLRGRAGASMMRERSW